MNVKKWFFLLLVFCLLICSQSFAAEVSSIGLDETWHVQKANFSKYQEIYIYSIDLRDMKTSMIVEDDEDIMDDEEVLEGLDESILQHIAYALHGVFLKRLNAVLPVNENEHDPKKAALESALLINFKLSACFDVQDKGLLTDLLLGDMLPPALPTLMHFECTLVDGATEKPLVTFTDQKEFLPATPEAPFSTPQDIEEISALFDIWGRRVTNFLIEKIPAQQ